MAVWRVVCSGSLYGTERWANVFHINPAGTFDAEAVFDAFEAVYIDDAAGGGMNWLNPCPGEVATGIFGVQFSLITLQAVESPAIPLQRVVSGAGGQNTAGGLPLDTSIIVSWRTAFAGRSFRGRTYLPPFHENQCEDTLGTFPHLAPGTQTGLAVNAEALLTQLTAADAGLCVYSRTNGNANTIVGGYIDNNFDTQRRRGITVAPTRVVFG